MMNDRLISLNEAIDAAIEAADDWDGCTNIGRQKRIEKAIKALPTMDAVPIVRCKDCKNYRYYPYPGSGTDGFCLSSDQCKRPMNVNDFCSIARRKTDG